MIKAKHDGEYKQVGFIKVRQSDGTYKDVEKKYGKINGEYGLVFEKGFTREVEGGLPLQINGIGKPLKDYDIEGNTYQSDGVTPDTPQEVVGCGDRTGNLFDGEIRQGGITDTNGAFISAVARIRTNLLSVIPNKIYSVSSNLRIRNIISYKDGVFIARLSDDDYGYNYTITIPDEANQIGLSFMPNRSDVTTLTPNDLEWLMLNEGSTPLSYEPYGYKVDVVTRGTNLFDISTIEAGRIDDTGEVGYISQTSLAVSGNTITFSTTSTWCGFVSDYIEINGVKPIISYGSFTSNENAILTGYLYYYDADKQYLGNTSEYLSNAKYARISFQSDVIVTNAVVSDIQVELGTEATSYEPYTPPITTPIYLDSPLYKIGDYSDSRRMTEEVRVIKELVLTGEENWQLYTNDTTIYQFYTNLPTDKISISGLSAYSNIVGYGATANNRHEHKLGCYPVTNGTQIAFQMQGAKEQFADISAWKSYLAEQYNNGTPVTVYYVLATPESKTVKPVEIPTLDGTTVIDVDTEVKPSNVYIKYKSKT